MKKFFLVVLFLMCAFSAKAQTFVQGGQQSLAQQTVFSLPFKNPNTAPCTLFATIRNPNAVVTDSNANTWVKLSNELWQTTTCVSGANTIFLTFSGPNYEQPVWAEYAGVLVLDGSIPALSEGTGLLASSLTTQANAGDLVLGWGSNANSNNDAVTAGPGFTLRGDVNEYLQDMVANTTGPVQSTVTYATADTWVTSVAAFKISVPPPPPLNFPLANSSFLFDDGTPVAPGLAVSMNQWNGSAWVGAGTIQSDSSGNLTGTLSVNPVFATGGMVTFQFGFNGIGDFTTQALPLSEFQQGSTGISLQVVVFKAAVVPKSVSVGLLP
jgi:hypothetical protein